MTILERAKADIERITGNQNEWGQPIVFIAPTGETVSVIGLVTKHHLGVDAELQKWVNTKNAHISVSEKYLTDLSYPLRNANGDVDLKDHKVQVSDSTGATYTSRIDQWFPDETIGLITCILGDWSS